MKGWLKLLVLGVIPILAVTTIAAQSNNDKGSQLIFQSNMAHKNFISVVNANSAAAVTVLTQYYNDEMEMVVWYLRVIPAGGNVLVDPFNHVIPTTERNVGDVIMESEKANSGHFVIAVTAVGTIATDAGTAIDSLYPEFIVGDLHDADSNIDNCGGDTFAAAYSENTVATDSEDCGDDDTTSKNVSDWGVDDARPMAFNHLSGHFTEALISTDAGGGDQTASWGGTPTVRPGLADGAMAADYLQLTGVAAAMLAEKAAGGAGATVDTTVGPGYTADGGNTITSADTRTNRVVNGGALVLPALHGGGDETKQIMLILSAADSFGDPGAYKLIAATTGITVTLMDNMGNALPDPKAEAKPVYGGTENPEEPPGIDIIVEGIRVRTDADLTDCSTGGTMIDGPWTLGHLTSIVPAASAGTGDFAGLDAEIDPMMNATPGWIKFARADAMVCKKDYGDGDGATSSVEDNDGVPTSDEREYTGGTQVAEQTSQTRNFVTVGRALLKFITADSTFAASWTLKSPAN